MVCNARGGIVGTDELSLGTHISYLPQLKFLVHNCHRTVSL
jgi:hypothetical protein